MSDRDAFVPGDMAVTLSAPVDRVPAVHMLYEWDDRAWRSHVALAQGTTVIIVATCMSLFEDGLPGCLVMTVNERPVTGWLPASSLCAWPAERMNTTGDCTRPPVDLGGRLVFRKTSRWSRLPIGAVVCAVCEQWFSYGTSMIGPCTGSTWDTVRSGPGRRDPMHDWVRLVEDAGD